MIGVVSDTHGLFRPEVAAALEGVEQILHLGDVGQLAILDELARIAPVTAIRGTAGTGVSHRRSSSTAAGTRLGSARSARCRSGWRARYATAQPSDAVTVSSPASRG